MGEPIEYGQYIVADPQICHGKLTFRGTRIMVKSILEYVAAGRSRESISAATGGKISVEAIDEAVRLASRLFLNHIDEYRAEPYLDYVDQRDATPASA